MSWLVNGEASFGVDRASHTWAPKHFEVEIFEKSSCDGQALRKLEVRENEVTFTPPAGAEMLSIRVTPISSLPSLKETSPRCLKTLIKPRAVANLRNVPKPVAVDAGTDDSGKPLRLEHYRYEAYRQEDTRGCLDLRHEFVLVEGGKRSVVHEECWDQKAGTTSRPFGQVQVGNNRLIINYQDGTNKRRRSEFFVSNRSG